MHNNDEIRLKTIEFLSFQEISPKKKKKEREKRTTNEFVFVNVHMESVAVWRLHREKKH